MNREELKKEAQEQVNYCTPLYPESFIQGYLAGAEPRENKIADIKANCDLAIEGREVKIKELEQKLEQTEKDLAISEHDREHNDYELVEVYKKVERLEKENAELRNKLTAIRKAKDKYDLSKDKSIIKAFGAEYTLFCVLERILEDWQEDDQLSKAKEHIKQLLDCLKQDTNDPETNYYVCQYMDKAEQFIKEIEK